MKRCYVCQKWLPRSEFHKRGISPDGLCYICKKCSKIKNRERYRANPEPIKARSKKWNRENPERKKQTQDAYREAHREELAAKQRDYLERNRERVKAYKSSPRALALKRLRRQKVKMEAFDAYGGPICSHCGEDRIQCLTLDHIAQDGTKHRQNGEATGAEFYANLKRNGYPPGYRVLCQNCQRIVYWEWKRPQLKQDEHNRKRRAKGREDKQECFEAYGGAICADCGESNLDALTLEHVNGDGARHRKETGVWGIYMYRLLKSQGYPDKDRYEVLCINCNVYRSTN